MNSHLLSLWRTATLLVATAFNLCSQEPPPENPTPPQPAQPEIQVDVLVYYSSMARDVAGGTEPLRAQILEGFSQANQIYANSLVPIHLEPVGIVLSSTPETGSIQVDGPTFGSNATTSRNDFRADLAILIIEEEEDAIDYSAGPGVPGSKGNSSAAYITVRRDSPYGLGIAFANRTGWLMGAGNERSEFDPRPGSFPESRGHLFEANGIQYATVDSFASGLLIPYFSNPDVLYQGVPTGVAGESDNASTLRLIGPIVANYHRCTNRVQFEYTTVRSTENEGVLHLRVLRSGPPETTARVRAVAQNGSARAGTDFDFSSQTLSFASGEMEKTIDIPILNDEVIRSSRSFRVFLDQTGLGTGVGMNHAVTVFLSDDETRFQFSADTLAALEGGPAVEAVVRRRSGFETPETVRLTQTKDGGAGRVVFVQLDGGNFAPFPQEIRFGAGETERNVRFAVQDDEVEWVDGKEFIRIEAGNPSPDTPLPTLELWCRDNDRPSRFAEDQGTRSSTTDLTGPFLTFPDGSILGTHRGNLGSMVSLVKVRPDGTSDPAFGPVRIQESTQPDSGLASGRVMAMAKQRDGRILVAGYFASVNGVVRQGLVRLMPDGTVDPGFAPQFRGAINGVCVMENGRIVVVGNFSRMNDVQQRCIARLFADGSLDENFAPAFDSPFSFPILLKSVAAQGDQLLVGGQFDRVNGEARSYLVRLNDDGSVDTAFTSPLTGVPFGLRVLPDHSFYAFGPFRNPRNRAARFMPNGAMDTKHRFVGLNGPVLDILPLAGGESLVCGSFGGISTFQTGLARYRANGSPDNTFGSRLRFPSTIQALAPLPSGEITAVGNFGIAGDSETWNLRRITGANLATELRIPRRDPSSSRFDALTIPGLTHRLERSGDMIQWETIEAREAIGNVETFVDPQPVPNAFYRLKGGNSETQAP